MNSNLKCKCMYDNIERINIKVDILMVLTISLMVMMLIPTQLYYNQLYKKSVVKDKKDDEDDDDKDDKDDDDEDEDDKDYKDDDDDEDDETNTENYNEKIVKNKEYDESSEITDSINIGCEDLACVNINNKCFCSESCKNDAILNQYIIENDVFDLELKDDIHKKLFKIKIN